MKRPLKYIAESIQAGYQARGRVKEDKEGTHFLIQMRNLGDDGMVARDSLTRFTPDRATAPYRVFDGDVLLQVRGARHHAAVVAGLPEDTLASSHFYILRVDAREVSPDYLAWYIRQPVAQSHLLRGAQGAGNVTVVTRAVFESLEVPVPPLATQTKLVELDRLQQREQKLTEALLQKRAEWLRGVGQRLAEGKHVPAGKDAT